MKELKSIRFIFLILIAVLFIVGCDQDDDANSGPITEHQLIVSPEKIMLNDDETGLLYLSIQPAGEFQWNITSKPDWIEISSSSGAINREIIELELTPDYTGLNEGKHDGTIEIITNGAGSAKINIELSVNPRPLADVNPKELTFSEGESEKVLTVSNIGTGFLNWEFQSIPDWISLNPESGIVGGGKDVEITATVQRTGLEVGTLMGQFVLTSNSEETNIEIDVALEVPELTIMTITESLIGYGYFENEKSFFIKNDGNVEFNWDWDDNSNSFVSVNPNSGTLNTGESIEVAMTIDRTDLLSGTYDLEVFFSNDKDQTTGLTIQIDHYDEEKWLIHGRVVDAEYDRNNDVLVVVSENPNELRVFDLSGNTVESVALNLPPTSLSVGLDGMHAAVGHNGSFSYVNLSTMELENNYAVTADVYDIVLAPNNWVYVFPRSNQWERIRCINLANGVETPHIGSPIFQRTKAQLHPSGDYIYGANNGLSPSDFEKYDIRGGTAQYLYDSPYHGTYSFNGDLWISDDGNRLFAKSRNVFISSTNQNTDITYNGQLSGEGNVITLDHSSAAQMVYAILNAGSSWNERPDNQIRMYETQFLAFQGTIELPGFLIPDGSGGGNFYDSEGHFGFFNSNGTQFHVLVKIQEGSGAQNEWAIVSVDVE